MKASALHIKNIILYSDRTECFRDLLIIFLILELITLSCTMVPKILFRKINLLFLQAEDIKDWLMMQPHRRVFYTVNWTLYAIPFLKCFLRISNGGEERSSCFKGYYMEFKCYWKCRLQLSIPQTCPTFVLSATYLIIYVYYITIIHRQLWLYGFRYEQS